MGNRLAYLTEAVNFITQKVGTIINQSAIFQTAAWGNNEQPDFFNQVLHIETNLSPVHLLGELLSIEKGLGRNRDEGKWMARTMDIDILFYNSEIIDLDTLKIPHPHLHERKFVLVPLQQIAGKYIHPGLNKSIDTLLKTCKDTLATTQLFIDEQKTNVI